MTTKNRPIFIEILPVLLLLFLAVFLSFWKGSATAVKDGINLWILCVVPSLFPYLFITAICSNLNATKKLGNLFSPITRKLFNVNGIGGYLFFISTFSGYPSGAKAVADAKKEGLLSDAESVRASAFCSIASPAFLISSIGGITFNSPRFGLLLFSSNLVVSFLIGIIFSFYKRDEKPSSKTANNFTPSQNLLFDSALNSVTSLLIVGALITVFYLLCEILIALKILTPFIKLLTFITKDEELSLSIISGSLEVTGGLKRLSTFSPKLALPIASALTGFGGVSVIMQSVTFLKSAKIKTAPFFLSKISSAVLNFLLSLILSIIFL